MPRQIALADDSKIVVCGSDNGVIHLFEAKTGTPIGVLHHSMKGLVQTVAVSYGVSIGLIR
jgi:hypothetical protein